MKKIFSILIYILVALTVYAATDSTTTTTNLKLKEAGSGANFITIKPPTSLPSDYTLTLPSGSAGAGQHLASDAAGNLFWENPAGGATVYATDALNNLAITAVNADINPEASGTINLGSGSLPWLNVYTLGVNTNRISGSADLVLNPPSGSVINANSHRLTNLLNPTSNQDAATKLYVDSATPPLGGDLSGSVDAATVIKIQNVGVVAGTPTSGAVLSYNGTDWAARNTLQLSQGGTNNAALAATAGGVVVTDGTKLINAGAGTAGQLFVSSGAATATWLSTLPIANGGTNNSSLAVTSGGVIYTDNSKLMNTGAGTTGYVLTSQGSGVPTWAAAAGGSKNYFDSQVAAGNTSGAFVAFYDTSGAALPVDMTGGSPSGTVTMLASGTNPLQGSSSLVLNKDAANRSGTGWSIDFNIDTSDKGKVLAFTADYLPSGAYMSGGASGAIVYFYDVTNSTLVQPMPTRILNHLLPSERFFTEVQVPSNSSVMRMGIYIDDQSSNAWTLKLDNLSFGPAAKYYGSPTTDWIAYTPTFSAGLGTVTSVSAWYRRVGDSIQIMANWSNGTVAASLASMTLPGSLTVDTSKLKTVGATSALIGQWVHDTNANETGSVLTYATGGSANQVYFGTSTISTAKLTPQNGTAIMSGLNPFSLMLTVPISGWSSSQLMSDSADTRVISLVTNRNGSAITANSTITAFTTVTKDTHASFNATSGVYTIPVAGDYLVNFRIATTGTANHRVKIMKNGVEFATGTSADATYFASTVNALIPCVAGDLITVQDDSTVTLASNAFNLLTIVRMAGPAQIMAGESPRSEYWYQGGNGYGSTNTAIRKYSNLRIGTGTAITASNSATAGLSYTINETGLYAVSMNECLASIASWGISLNSTQLTTDTSTITASTAIFAGSISVANHLYGTAVILKLTAGDVIRPHNGGAGDGTFADRAGFRIVKLNN